MKLSPCFLFSFKRFFLVSSNAGAGSNWKKGILASLLFSNPHSNTLQVRAPVRGVSRRYQLFNVLLTAVRRQNRQHIVQRTVNSTTHIAVEETVKRTLVSFPRIGVVKMRLQLLVGVWKLQIASPFCSAVLSVIPGGLLVLHNIWDFLSSSWGSVTNTGHLVWTHRELINAVGNFVKNHPKVVSFIGRIGFRLWNFYAKCLGVPAKFRDCMHVAWALLQCFGVHHTVVPAGVFFLAYVHARPVYRRYFSSSWRSKHAVLFHFLV